MKKAKRETGEMAIFEVENVRELKWGVVFDLMINDVKLYSCRLVDGDNGKFIGFPSYKGKNGKYYTHCYFPFSDKDMKKVIDVVEDEL